MKVDVHKVFTTLYNVELNEFIHRFGKEETFETIRTGGLWNIRVIKKDIFQ